MGAPRIGSWKFHWNSWRNCWSAQCDNNAVLENKKTLQVWPAMVRISAICQERAGAISCCKRKRCSVAQYLSKDTFDNTEGSVLGSRDMRWICSISVWWHGIPSLSLLFMLPGWWSAEYAWDRVASIRVLRMQSRVPAGPTHVAYIGPMQSWNWLLRHKAQNKMFWRKCKAHCVDTGSYVHADTS